jgi:lambda family phage portal protein
VTLLDHNGRAIAAGAAARVRAQASATRSAGEFAGGAAYDGGQRHGQWFSDWTPRLQSADREIIPARGGVVGRARDLVRNDPVAASAVQRRKNAAVGAGWRLSSKPLARALGISFQAARKLGQEIEAEWEQYANGHSFLSDAERKLIFGGQLRVASTHLQQDGEYLGVVEYAHDEPTRYRTRLRLVDPDRLSNPNGRPDSDLLRGGVEFNANGVPIRYHIRERHPADLGLSGSAAVWRAWDRYSTPLGRPQVLHGFDAERAGQTRGVSRFAASLKSFRALSRFTDATLQAATANALMLGFIKSSSGPEAVSESFSAQDLSRHETSREEFYSRNPVEIAGVRMPVFPLGDEVTFATASKDVTSFDSFVRAILRIIAASLGVTYEELAMDFSQTNYSSARAAFLIAWAETQAFMGVLRAGLVQPFYVAFLEEAFDSGYIVPPPGAPDFYDAIDAYAKARWIGPGRGYVDPTKEILAAAARIEAGVSTLEDECADQGKDWEEVLEQAAFERERKIELNLPLAADDQGAAAAADDARRTATPPEDARPENAGPGARTALGAIAAFADGPAHAAFLDARPGG